MVGVVDLDPDREQLLLEDRAALLTRRSDRRVEAEDGLLPAAGPDTLVVRVRRRRTTGATVLLERCDRLLRVEVVLLEVGELAAGVRAELVLRVVQRLEAGGDRAVQRLDQRPPVQTLGDCRPHPLLLQERIALRAPLDVQLILA